MTLKQFFAKARRMGRYWHVTRGGQTVECANGKCPLAAVTGTWSPSRAARILGMKEATAVKIATAADFYGDKNRAWLLKNLGVKAS